MRFLIARDSFKTNTLYSFTDIVLNIFVNIAIDLNTFAKFALFKE